MWLWGATLMAAYPEEHLEPELARLTQDQDPRVRKAAIQTLGRIGDKLAADRAVALLGDPLPYVRAHAARALGELGRSDLARDVAALLGDQDWWTRLAAREALRWAWSPPERKAAASGGSAGAPPCYAAARDRSRARAPAARSAQTQSPCRPGATSRP